jgi:hypothetical protein
METVLVRPQAGQVTAYHSRWGRAERSAISSVGAEQHGQATGRVSSKRHARINGIKSVAVSASTLIRTTFPHLYEPYDQYRSAMTLAGYACSTATPGPSHVVDEALLVTERGRNKLRSPSIQIIAARCRG